MILNLICMATQTIFALQELRQMLSSGLCYWTEMWNYQQILVFVIYTMYFLRRYKDPSEVIIPSNDIEQDSDRLKFWIGSNTALLILSAFYAMNYARVYESFGMFIKLCKETLLGVRNFMLFLCFWVFMFAWLFKVSGSVVNMDGSKEDYKSLEGNTKQLLESFRNTIGDNQIPSYFFW